MGWGFGVSGWCGLEANSHLGSAVFSKHRNFRISSGQVQAEQPALAMRLALPRALQPSLRHLFCPLSPQPVPKPCPKPDKAKAGAEKPKQMPSSAGCGSLVVAGNRLCRIFASKSGSEASSWSRAYTTWNFDVCVVFYWERSRGIYSSSLPLHRAALLWPFAVVSCHLVLRGDDLGSFSLFWGHQLWLFGLSSAEDKAQRCDSTAGAMPYALRAKLPRDLYTWETSEVKSPFYCRT